MKRIAVIGVPNTGKSIISNSLSLMSGIPLLNERKDLDSKEVLNGRLFSSNRSWVEAFSSCLSTFVSRVVSERINHDGFISDGSVLNEVILNIVGIRMQMEKVPAYRILKRLKFQRQMKEYLQMSNALLNVVKSYAKENYEYIIWLVPVDLAQDGGKAELGIRLFSDLLEDILKESGFKTFKYNTNNYKVALTKMVVDLGIKQIYSPENALFMTKDKFHFRDEIVGMNRSIEKVVVLKLS